MKNNYEEKIINIYIDYVNDLILGLWEIMIINGLTKDRLKKFENDYKISPLTILNLRILCYIIETKEFSDHSINKLLKQFYNNKYYKNIIKKINKYSLIKE